MKKSINIKKNKIGYYNFKKIPHLDKLEKYYKEKYFSKNISYKDKLLSSEKLYLKVHALITVPNDFSFLQKTTNKVVKKKNYWLAPPEHLNYFNNYNFKNFAENKNFKILDAISDFPVELFLLIKEFDYTKDKQLGKNIHLLRCEITNYFFKNYELNKLYQIFKSFNELNVGRNNIYLIKKI